MSTKNSSDTIGNRTRNLLACSAVPQPTAPPRTPLNTITHCCIVGGEETQKMTASILNHFVPFFYTDHTAIKQISAAQFCMYVCIYVSLYLWL
jgi:hypothetical protein